MALHYPDPMISFTHLHRLANRATPTMFCKYRLALQLYKTFDNRVPETEWLHLNLEQINTRRQTTFHIMRCNNLLVGQNILTNRFRELNGMIPLEWFNRSIDSFKILCKNKFLTF